MKLHELKGAPGSRKARTRVGRGISAGQGKTSGRGQKGQGSRKSSGTPRGFEGGQLPLQQRLPYLRGFTNIWRREFETVNIGKLNKFEKNSIVDGVALASLGLISKPGDRVKVLAAGRLTVPLTVRVARVSAAAQKAIEAAGGRVEQLEDPAMRWAGKTKRAPGGRALTKAAAAAKAAASAGDDKPSVKKTKSKAAPVEAAPAEAATEPAEGGSETEA